MFEGVVGILFIIALIFVAILIFYLLARVYWLRTIITLLAMGASIVFSIMLTISRPAGEEVVIEDLVTLGTVFCVGIFYLFGKYFARKTGEVEKKNEIDFEKRTVTHTKTKKTYTFSMVVGSVIAGAVYAFATNRFGLLVGAGIPALVIIGKIFGIRSYILNRKSAIDVYDDDDQGTEDVTVTRF